MGAICSATGQRDPVSRHGGNRFRPSDSSSSIQPSGSVNASHSKNETYTRRSIDQGRREQSSSGSEETATSGSSSSSSREHQTSRNGTTAPHFSASGGHSSSSPLASKADTAAPDAYTNRSTAVPSAVPSRRESDHTDSGPRNGELRRGPAAGAHPAPRSNLSSATVPASSSLLANGNRRVSFTGDQSPLSKSKLSSTAAATAGPGSHLSTRAMLIVQRAEDAVQRCGRLPGTPEPTAEDATIFSALTLLRASPNVSMFLSHPEISLSNRASVMVLPQFCQDESILGFQLRATYNAGTVGQSYFAVRGVGQGSATEAAAKQTALKGSKNMVFRILKLVNFSLRLRLLYSIIDEQRIIVNVNHDSVLKIFDVLNDEAKENVIVMTGYHVKGNIAPYAGKLGMEPEKYRQILTSVATGLRILHSHRVYHHNLKLENVLETDSGSFCVADAGFWRIFATQCPESLVYNGELTSLPPEVFDTSRGYFSGKVNEVAPDVEQNAGAVDMWGYGVLMYRLAYGKDPIEIAGCLYEQVVERVQKFRLQFPTQEHWPFADQVQTIISRCMERQPSKRPTILQLLKHPFFKDALMGGSSYSRSVTTLGSFRRGTAHSGSPSGPRTPSQHFLPGASMSNVSISMSTKSQQRNGYIVDRFVGRGRFSETMLVHLRRNPSRLFAFKMIKNRNLSRFVDEMQGGAESEFVRHQLAVTVKMNHPNVIGYMEIVDDKKGTCFVVQDYMPSGALVVIPPIAPQAHLTTKDASGAPPGKCFRDLLVDVLLGLIYLHDNGIAHLSLTPSNIFYCTSNQRYKITDFGPLFFTEAELNALQKSKRPVYNLPRQLQSATPLKGTDLDIFFFGLLAASQVPEVFKHVWHTVQDSTKAQEFSTETVLQAVRDPLSRLPAALLSLIEDLLEGRLHTSRDIAKHAYFKNVLVLQKVPKIEVQVTASELKNAVRAKPENRDEARMQDLLGQDPFQESQMLSSVVDAALTSPDSGNDISVCMGENGGGGTTVAEVAHTIHFKGDNPNCGQCGAELALVLYQCPECDDVIRCGKCTVTDNHAAGHRLAPYVVHTVEHTKNGNSTAIVVPPATIKDAHARETIEMKANIPAGSLSQGVSLHRPSAADRSFAAKSTQLTLDGNSGGAGNGKVLFTDIEGAEYLSDDGNDANCSTTFNFRSCASLRVGPPNVLNDSQVDAKGIITPVDIGSVSPPAAPKFSLMKGGVKKLALPKAEEMDDDLDWQGELEQCRAQKLSDLLLYNYELFEVPKGVFNPPMLHVTVLDISKNSITSIPHELSFLSRLKKLVVSYNKLEELPESLGNLGDLETLDASHNMLTDLPATFMFLCNLTSVALDYNNFARVPECLLEIVPRSAVAPSESMSVSGGAPMQTHSRQSSGMGVNIAGLSQSESALTNAIGELFPRLKLIFLVANDRLTVFPDIRQLERFAELSIAFDNEPSLYKYYMENELDKKLPNVSVNWNKIYPDEIIPYLYCGSLRSAQSQMVYKKLNISYLLTVGRELVPVPPDHGKHKVIVVDDIPGADIMSSFKEAIAFIEESQRAKAGCLVHCFAGLSRSATTVIAYLMSNKHMRLDEAYLQTKKGRPAIFPNKGFFEQLTSLDKELYPNAARSLNIEALGRPS